jgi:hypothetical protein
MAATPFFPPVSDHGRLAATVHGVWEPITEPDFLLKLAAGLVIHTPGNTNLSNVRALPDVWGQLVAFQSAWEDDRHPLENMATEEWRGILALLGLADWRQEPLHCIEVRLRDLIDSPFINGMPADAQVPNLARVIDAFMPRHERERFEGWEHISILLHGKKVEEAQTLALLLPSTLVVPSRTYKLDPATTIPWVGLGGYPLKDPVKLLTNPRERQALADYLGRLHQAVGKWDLSKQSRRRGLVTRTLGRLKDFIDDLNAGDVWEDFEYTSNLVGTLPSWNRQAPLCSVPRRGGRTAGSDTRLPLRRDLTGFPSGGAVLYGGSLRACPLQGLLNLRQLLSRDI